MSASAPGGLTRFLARLLGRSDLNSEEQRAVLRLPVHASQYRPNHDIVSPGQTVDHACLIEEGLAGRYDQRSDGQRQINAFYIPGDMADLHSVVWPTAQWGIVALANTKILRIPHRDLRQLADNFPALALAFWRDGIVDASILAKWIAVIGHQDARSRMAHLLCEIGMRLEIAQLDSRDSFLFDATQAQLADALGLTSVHVNRTLQALRAEGIVETFSHRVVVNDWRRLSAIAMFDPGYLLLRKPGVRRA